MQGTNAVIKMRPSQELAWYMPQNRLLRPSTFSYHEQRRSTPNAQGCACIGLPACRLGIYAGSPVDRQIRDFSLAYL
eukprot:10989854-Karenia_brevis.AAC.1